jgi:hypothetical protein
MRLHLPLSVTMSVVPRGYRLRLEIATQVIQTPTDADYYRVLPLFKNFTLTVGYQPTRLSWLALPWRPRVRPDLAAGEHSITVARPEVRSFLLDSADVHRGQAYVVLMSLTGQGSTWLSPFEPLYLTLDAWTIVGLDLLSSPAFTNFFGILDAAGRAGPQLDLGRFTPLPPALRGQSLHLAPVVFDLAVDRPGAPVSLRLR